MSDLNFTVDTNADLAALTALNGRVKFLLKEKSGKKITHTGAGGEKMDLSGSILSPARRMKGKGLRIFRGGGLYIEMGYKTNDFVEKRRVIILHFA